MDEVQSNTTTRPKEDTPSKSSSSIPVLGEGFSENSPTSAQPGNPLTEPTSTAEGTGKDQKTGRGRLLNLLKKKDEKSNTGDTTTTTTTTSPGLRSPSPLSSPSNIATSPKLQHAFVPASPGRGMRSASPHLASPASSQIFERNVQDDVEMIATSPAIPSHINTENHIPSVLDASSMAITDDHLNPDTVEIVTHSVHQPAAVNVTGGAVPTSAVEPLSPYPEDQIPATASGETEDNASNYGALDSADVRRLSFISFADVVHAEHQADHNSLKDSSVLSGGVSSIASPPLGGNRSPSPIRSPISPPLSSSMSGSPNLKPMESSPNRSIQLPGSPRAPAVPGTHSPPERAELTIETMRQALRKTGSGDLSGARSAPLSAVGGEDGSAENQPFHHA